MAENIKVVQLKDPTTDEPVSPVVNIGSLYTNNGKRVENLVSYTLAGTDVTIPEIPSIKDEIEAELDYIPKSEKGVASGVATLDQTAKVPAAQLPIVDNLTTNSSTSVLSAAQGKQLKTEIESLKSSVSNGKALVASAITDKGVTTAADATFQQMADNIRKIPSGRIYGTIRYPINGDNTMFDKYPIDSYTTISGIYSVASAYFINTIYLDTAIVGLSYNQDDYYRIKYLFISKNGDIKNITIDGPHDQYNTGRITGYSNNVFKLEYEIYSGKTTLCYKIDKDSGNYSKVGLDECVGTPTLEDSSGYICEYSGSIKLLDAAYYANFIKIINKYKYVTELCYISYSTPLTFSPETYKSNGRVFIVSRGIIIPITTDSDMPYYANIGSKGFTPFDQMIVKIKEHLSDAIILEIQNEYIMPE